jgi:hypothetical protein
MKGAPHLRELQRFWRVMHASDVLLFGPKAQLTGWATKYFESARNRRLFYFDEMNNINNIRSVHRHGDVLAARCLRFEFSRPDQYIHDLDASRLQAY